MTKKGSEHNGFVVDINPVDFGGHEIYSKEDAVFHAWSRQNPIDMDDLFSGKKVTLPSITPPADFVTSLEQGTLSPLGMDFFTVSYDFNAQSIDTLEQSVDYIASRYAVMKEYIDTNISKEEQASHYEQLESLFHAGKNRLAESLSDKVGSFFEEYGTPDEKERIYQSIFAKSDAKAAAYSAFIQSNKNYAGIDGIKEEWLKNDSAYLASELRIAAKGVLFEAVDKSDTYTLDELQKMHTFVKEMESYMFRGSNPPERISGSGTEEQIGLQLSEIVLKGKMFNQYAGVSVKVQNTIDRSIDAFLRNTVKKLQEYVEDQIKMKGSYVPSRIRRGLIALDEDSIYNIIDKVKKTYESTGDSYQSFLDGAAYAKHQGEFKKLTGQVKGIYRYQYDVYWNNFFESSRRFSTLGIPDLAAQRYGYFKKESGIESFLSSWNNFAEQITGDKSANLNVNNFSTFG
ncbi:MAG: hypothetical protein E7L17_06110 [Clostridium sp.]|uniref:hypothetical protein n=1 Tax=Clostridium sp. TaxID=1506 RepID=UPI002911B6E4|nr:hypothetical protein [Clostridium sp.]MDU7337671.1 hypothetical protein [Clostridium sp.]